MNPAMEKLWYGSLSPYETCGADDPQIKELTALLQRNKETLHQILEARQLECFEKYLECSQEYTDLISMHAFRDGFCLASRLMIESLTQQS